MKMIKRIIVLRYTVVAACVLSAWVAAATAKEPANLSPGVDWKSFMARQDPIWNRLPRTWMEGAFIGNGRLGAMIYKGEQEPAPAADVLAWTIGRSDLYDIRDPSYEDKNWELYTRLPIGRMHLCPVGKNAEGGIRIDLWNGEARGTISTDSGELEWSSWVQDGEPDGGVVVIDLKAKGAEKDAAVKWQAFTAGSPRHYPDPPAGQEPNPPGRLEKIGETEVWVQPLLVGGDYATAWKVLRPAENRQIVYIAVANRIFEGGAAEAAAAAVERAAQKEFDALQEENRAWWHAFYTKSFLSIPDARLESHYWIQMYKLASATRENGVVIDTCGPWLKVRTAWPACWWNLNVQLAHYPIPVANHLELEQPLIRLLEKELENGRLIENAPESMRHDSAYFGNPTTTMSLINDDVYWRGQNLSGRSRPAVRLNHLPWICHTLWEHYRRNMDDTFLRATLFPLTRRAYSFIFHFIEEGDDGRLHIRDTFSSEYGAADDANEALAMVQWGCGTLLWMCDRLDIDDPDIPRWKDIQKRLVDPPVDENGLMIGSDVSFEVPHRHYSHLMALIPFRIWDFHDEEARALAYRSIEWFLRTSRNLTGYSYTGASCMYAALGDGDRALDVLYKYLRGHDGPSTMYTEPNHGGSPTMETPLSAARCVQEMLLQSYDVIRVFPALPTAWKDVAFDKLLAEGAFEVSAVRKGGKTEFVRIRSLAGEPCRIKPNLPGAVRTAGKREFTLHELGDGIYTLDLKKGEEVLLYTGETVPEPIIMPFPAQEGKSNRYGLPK